MCTICCLFHNFWYNEGNTLKGEHDMKAKPLGKAINKARNQQNIDYLKMADDLQIDPQRIMLIEQGRTIITESELEQIQTYLSLSNDAIGKTMSFNNTSRPRHFFALFMTPNKTNKFRLSKTLHAIHMSLQKGFRVKWKDASKDVEDFLFPYEGQTQEVPHLYIKVFLVFATLFGLAFLIDEYTTVNFSLVIMVPLAWLVFIQELHYPKTLSFFRTLLYFAVGGITSILLVTIIREITGYPMGFIGDILTGFIEELAKILIVIVILRRLKPQHVITGLLVGFAVGAGFDVFESADYGIIALLSSENGYYDMISSGAWRGFFALVGIGHHFWTGMLAAGLMMLRKTYKVTYSSLFQPTFIILFIYVMFIHAAWNFSEDLWMMLIVIAISLFSFLLLLHKALNEGKIAPLATIEEEGIAHENLYIA